MHRRDGFAQPVGLAGEVTADLVGVEVALGEQVAHAGGGHRPALGRVAFILGRHAQRTAGAGVRSGQLVGTQQACHVRVSGPAEDPVELDIGVDAWADAAKHLQDGIAIEDHAGVALLGVRHAWIGVQRQGDARLFAERHAFPGGRRADQRQQKRRGVRIVERVEGGAIAVGADGGYGVVFGGRLGVPADDHLVALGRTVGVGHVHQHEIQIVAQTYDETILRGCQFAATPGIPALLG